MTKENKPNSPIENSSQIPEDTKKGCLATAALLTWIFPPLWPVAIATTWAMYPKTSKIVAISLAGGIIALLVGSSMYTSINNNKPSPEKASSTALNSEPEKTYQEKESPDIYSQMEAEVKCRRAVKENLKDPGSLRIGWGDVVSGNNADNQDEWLVKFPFRARNSFNAVTPGLAQCTIDKTTGEITLLDIQ